MRGLDLLVAGSFQADFGQGLVIGNPASSPFGTGLTTQLKSVKQGLKGSSHFRNTLSGVAIQGHFRSFRVVILQTTNLPPNPRRGFRISWMGQRAILGVSLARSLAGGTPESVSGRTAGIDFDGVLGDVNIFGEFAFRENGHLALQTGFRWDTGKLEGGMVFGRRQNPKGVHETESYRGVAHIRWKPERGTLLQMTIGGRFETGVPILVQSVGIRRRTRKGITLMGVWRLEREERLAGAENGFNRLQTQIDCSPIKRIRLRSALEWTRWKTGQRATQSLVDVRYRAASRSSLSLQWRRTVRRQASPESHSTRTINHSQWTVFWQRSLGKILDCSVRWGRTNRFELTATPLPTPDYSWSIQLTTVW